MPRAIMDGTGDPFNVFDPGDPSKQAGFDCSTQTSGTSCVFQTYPINGTAYPTGATTEGNANEVLISGGGAGASNVWTPLASLLAPVSVSSGALSAAVSAQNLIASTSAAGFYRVSWVASIITAASGSSTLGGTNGFQLTFTDPNDSVVKTSNPQSDNHMSSTGNTTATSVSGVLCAWCKVSTALKYSFDYTSSGGTAMVYDINIKVEFLG